MAQPLPWNLVADDYAREVAPMFERYADEALAATRVGRGHHIVDVATGPGTLALRAARIGATVEAIDFSEKMVAQLRRRAAAAGLEIEARVGDGMELPYPADRFDAGFSMFGLFMFADRDRGFRELRRVVKPGKPVAVTSWLSFERVPALRTLFAALAERMPNLPFGGGEVPLGTSESFTAEMEAAGFRDINVIEICHGKDYPSTEELWASLTRTLAPLVLLARNLGAAWPALADQLRGDLIAGLGDGPLTIEMPAWLGIASA
jgi:ubiquinone/menaquinone biosynthesis C-methylase UbiE